MGVAEPQPRSSSSAHGRTDDERADVFAGVGQPSAPLKLPVRRAIDVLCSVLDVVFYGREACFDSWDEEREGLGREDSGESSGL